MKKLSTKQSVKINANAEKVWDIIGPNFVNISTWGRTIEKSWVNKDVKNKFSDAPAGGRFCQVKGLGEIDEKIIHYNSRNQEITWSAEGKKLPGFLKNLQNEINVKDNGDGTSTATSNITANLKGLGGFFLGGAIKKNFEKAITGFLQDWKIYAETGKVSERKQKELSN